MTANLIFNLLCKLWLIIDNDKLTNEEKNKYIKKILIKNNLMIVKVEENEK